MRVLLVSGLIVVVDQVTKAITRTSLSLHQSIPVIKDFFHLTYVTNDGMAFGIDFPYGVYIFTILAMIMTGVLLVYLWQVRDRPLLLRLALSLIIAGAVGNLIDRLLFGEVVDFMDFMIRGHHWYVFNVADSAVTVGMALFLYHSFFIQPKTAAPSH